MQNIKYIALFLCVVLFTQCEVEHKDFKPSNGKADFTKFVALGDSYTAGYTDGALGLRGQENGFSYILAKQLENVGSAAYKQPLVAEGASVGSAGNSYYTLQVVGGNLTPAPGVGDRSVFADRLYNASAPIQNLGVPGAKSSHLLATVVNADPLTYYSEANPFFGRFASSKTTSVIADALAQAPSFVSLWIGGNDVLGYALAGGEADMVTPADMFGNYMGAIANQLFSGETKGAIANIPGIEALPYFNVISYDALEIDQATADLLNGAYAPYNAGSEAMGLPKIVFVAGKNALVIADADYAHPGKIRQLKEGEKVLLPALGNIRNAEIGWGSKLPIPMDHILDLEEVATIKNATTAYNNVIKTIATQYELAHVDLNALMTKASTTGVLVDGNMYSSTFVSGGTFSLDGIHATGKGNAIIANEFIKAINMQYEANIPMASVNDYDSVVYP